MGLSPFKGNPRSRGWSSLYLFTHIQLFILGSPDFWRRSTHLNRLRMLGQCNLALLSQANNNTWNVRSSIGPHMVLMLAGQSQILHHPTGSDRHHGRWLIWPTCMGTLTFRSRTWSGRAWQGAVDPVWSSSGDVKESRFTANEANDWLDSIWCNPGEEEKRKGEEHKQCRWETLTSHPPPHPPSSSHRWTPPGSWPGPSLDLVPALQPLFSWTEHGHSNMLQQNQINSGQTLRFCEYVSIYIYRYM